MRTPLSTTLSLAALALLLSLSPSCGGETDEGAQPSSSDACPSDASSLVGQSCSSPGKACGGEGCTAEQFCQLVRCQNGKWGYAESFPRPQNKGGGGQGGGQGGNTQTGQGGQANAGASQGGEAGSSMGGTHQGCPEGNAGDAIGMACAPEQIVCGGENCTGTTYCPLIRCEGGKWRPIESAPPPPHGGSGGAAGAGGSSGSSGSSGQGGDAGASAAGAGGEASAGAAGAMPGPTGCPAAAPAMNGDCDVQGLSCSYGDESLGACRKRFVCDGQAWQVGETWGTCTTPDVITCSPTPPTDGFPCGKDASGYGVCAYDDGTQCTCACSYWGSFGLCGPTERHWLCAPPPLTGCPSQIPNEGTACDNPEAECKYGGCGAMAFCMGGAWVWAYDPCPK